MKHTGRLPSRPGSRPVLLFLVLTLLATWSDGAAAGQSSPVEAVAGDRVALQDAAACLEHTTGLSGVQCNVLYAHIFGSLENAPLNVQVPPAHAPDDAGGIFMPIGYEPLWDLNELSLFPLPRLVDGVYDYHGAEAPRIHYERGITHDIRVPADVPIVGHWFLSADASNAPLGDPLDDNQPGAGATPCVTVRMTLQTGRYFGQGDVLAVGETTKHVISAPGASIGQEVPCPGPTASEPMGPEAVTEFVIELEPMGDQLVIPKGDGFTVHVEWVMFDPTEDGQHRIYSHQTTVRTGSEHRPRLVLPLQHAMAIGHVGVRPHEGQAYLRASVDSPWGTYDLDHGSLKAALLNEDGDEMDAPTLELRRVIMDPLQWWNASVAEWRWDPHSDGVPPGNHTLRLSAQNWQHTATTVEELPVLVSSDGRVLIGDVEVVPGVVEEAGGLMSLAALALVGLSWAVGRRARRGSSLAS